MKWLPFIFLICSILCDKHLLAIPEPVFKTMNTPVAGLRLHGNFKYAASNAKTTRTNSKRPSRVQQVGWLVVWYGFVLFRLLFTNRASNAIFICPQGIQIMFILIHNKRLLTLSHWTCKPWRRDSISNVRFFVNVGKRWIIYLIKTNLTLGAFETPLSRV